MKIKFNTEYNKNKYSFLIDTAESSTKESILVSEINWIDRSYTLKANSSTEGNGKLLVDIHLDRIRDVRLEVWGTAKRFSDNFGLEVKWDFNR